MDKPRKPKQSKPKRFQTASEASDLALQRYKNAKICLKKLGYKKSKKDYPLLQPKTVFQIRDAAALGHNASAIAKVTGLSYETVKNVITGRRYGRVQKEGYLTFYDYHYVSPEKWRPKPFRRNICTKKAVPSE